ncbi:MAG: ribbon-helix-helix domain-containing protein [Candidatus Eremiobacterota bacterium]
MAITVRLPSEIEEKLVKIAAIENRSKSDIIREALELYLDRFTEHSPFELGKKFFGRHGSGIGDLSINSEKILQEKIRGKYNAKKPS